MPIAFLLVMSKWLQYQESSVCNMSQLTILRNVLLVSLIAILLFIMYKRLIHLLQKQHVQAKYPAIDAALIWAENLVSLELKIKMNIEVNICKENGEIIETIMNQPDATGELTLSFDTTKLEKGKYYFEIITPNEKALRYFVIH
jgi:hypothetical protein